MTSEPAPDSGRVAMPATRAWTALICAGPGISAGLLTDWLCVAAAAADLAVTARSVAAANADEPSGMLVEICGPAHDPADATAAPHGPVDLLVAPDHGELARAIAAGYAHASTTTIVASSDRPLTPAERDQGLATPSERQIDEAATRVSRRYVTFRGQEVSGWYSLPPSAASGMLLGALCSSGAFPLPPDLARHAIARVGIQPEQQLTAFDVGVRVGQRPDGRVSREQTAAQFVRKRRSTLPRRERPAFDQMIASIDEGACAPEHRQLLREAAHLLSDFESVAYATEFLARCFEMARAENTLIANQASAGIDEPSVIPAFVRGLLNTMLYADVAYAAAIKVRPGRLPAIRRRHGIARGAVYEVRDHIPVAPGEIRALLRGNDEFDPTRVLEPHRRLVVRSNTLSGVVRLRLLARLAKKRASTRRHELECETAAAYVDAVRDAMKVDRSLARMVAQTAHDLPPAGAPREGARAGLLALWGHVVRQSIALDEASPRSDHAITRMTVPTVCRRMVCEGPLAIWDLADPVLNAALHCSRGGSYADAVAHIAQACGLASPLGSSTAATDASADETQRVS